MTAKPTLAETLPLPGPAEPVSLPEEMPRPLSPKERLEQQLRTASGTGPSAAQQLERDLTRMETQRAMLAAWSLSFFEPGGWDEVKAAMDREMALYGEPRRGERFEWEPEYPAFVPAEKGIDIRETLAWGGDIYELMSPYATERTTKHTPGVRASNILYLSEATGLDIGAAEVVYDGLVKQFFGDKQPDDIRPVTKLVHRIYTDGWLAEHGFNPPVMRVAQRFVQGDLSVDWPTVFENMPSELVPEFLQYINLYAPEKERGIVGKTFFSFLRGTTSSADRHRRMPSIVAPAIVPRIQEIYTDLREKHEQETGMKLPLDPILITMQQDHQTPWGINRGPEEGERKWSDEQLQVAGELWKKAEEIYQDGARHMGQAREALWATEGMEPHGLAEKILVYGAQVVPDMIASVGVGILTGTGPVGRAAYWYSTIVTGQYDMYRDLGFSHDLSRKMAMITAVPVALVNTIQVGQLVKLGPAAREKAVRIAELGLLRYLLSKGADFAITYGKEWGEEVVEAWIEMGGIAIADALSEEHPEINWGEDVIPSKVEELKQAAYGLFLPVAIGKGIEISDTYRLIRSLRAAGMRAPLARAYVEAARKGTPGVVVPDRVWKAMKSDDRASFQAAINNPDIKAREAVLKDLAERYMAEQYARAEQVAAEILKLNDLDVGIEPAALGETPEGEIRTGAVGLNDFGRLVIRLAFSGYDLETGKFRTTIEEGMAGPDVQTGAHEAFHVLEAFLDPDELRIIDTWFGGDREKAARAFGEFVAKQRGEMPETPVDCVWAHVANVLAKIKTGLLLHTGRTYQDVFRGIMEGKAKRRAEPELGIFGKAPGEVVSPTEAAQAAEQAAPEPTVTPEPKPAPAVTVEAKPEPQVDDQGRPLTPKEAVRQGYVPLSDGTPLAESVGEHDDGHVWVFRGYRRADGRRVDIPVMRLSDAEETAWREQSRIEHEERARAPRETTAGGVERIQQTEEGQRAARARRALDHQVKERYRALRDSGMRRGSTPAEATEMRRMAEVLRAEADANPENPSAETMYSHADRLDQVAEVIERHEPKAEPKPKPKATWTDVPEGQRRAWLGQVNKAIKEHPAYQALVANEEHLAELLDTLGGAVDWSSGEMRDAVEGLTPYQKRIVRQHMPEYERGPLEPRLTGGWDVQADWVRERFGLEIRDPREMVEWIVRLHERLRKDRAGIQEFLLAEFAKSGPDAEWLVGQRKLLGGRGITFEELDAFTEGWAADNEMIDAEVRDLWRAPEKREEVKTVERPKEELWDMIGRLEEMLVKNPDRPDAEAIQTTIDRLKAKAGPPPGGYVPFEVREAPLWFSKLEQVIRDKMPSVMSVQDLDHWIRKQGIKAEELVWRGLDELIAMAEPGRKVTKEQVREVLANHPIELEEQVLLEPLLVEEERATEIEPVRYRQYTLEGRKHSYQELLLTWANAAREFIASHFPDIKNIVAHARVDTRVDAAGDTVLFIEEVQSDWHQKGREAGYGAPSEAEFEAEQARILREAAGLTEEARRLGVDLAEPITSATLMYETVMNHRARILELRDRGQTSPAEESTIPDLTRLVNTLDILREEEQALWAGEEAGRVPEAPWKDTWVDLVLKRLFRYAADQGYDAVAWTTGEQQVQRYISAISKVESVRYHPETGELLAGKKGAEERVATNVRPENVFQYIGKEAAEKLLAGKPDDEGFVSMSGKDIRVGGQFLRLLYDIAIPKFVRKMAKKYGVEVETGGVVVDEAPRIDAGHVPLTPEQRAQFALQVEAIVAEAKSLGMPEGRVRYDITDEPTLLGPLHSVEAWILDRHDYPELWQRTEALRRAIVNQMTVIKVRGDDGNVLKTFPDEASANAWTVEQGLSESYPVSEPVHKVRLTPEMEADISGKPQPMFEHRAKYEMLEQDGTLRPVPMSVAHLLDRARSVEDVAKIVADTEYPTWRKADIASRALEAQGIPHEVAVTKAGRAVLVTETEAFDMRGRAAVRMGLEPVVLFDGEQRTTLRYGAVEGLWPLKPPKYEVRRPVFLMDDEAFQRAFVRALAQYAQSRQKAESDLRKVRSVELRPLKHGVRVRVESVSGEVKVGDLLHESRILNLEMKKAERASQIAYRAGRREEAQRLKAEYKEKARKARELKQYRERMNKAIARLNRPIPQNVHWTYRDAIRAVTAGIDPHRRTQKTMESRQKLAEFLARHPERLADIPRKRLEHLNDVPLNEYTLQDLEMLVAERERLIKQGQLKDKLYRKARKRSDDRIAERLKSRLPKEAETAEGPIVGEPKPSLVERIKKKWHAGNIFTLRPTRIFDMLDGGRATYDGPFFTLLWAEYKDAKARAIHHKTRRIGEMKAAMDELGLTLQQLTRSVRIPGVRSTQGTFTLAHAIGVYVYNQNQRARAAIRFGNGFSEQEVQTVIDYLTPNQRAFGDWLILAMGERKDIIFRIAADLTNKVPPEEERYFPMHRRHVQFASPREDIEHELTSRSDFWAWYRAQVRKGFTIPRQDIPAEYQKPIELNVLTIWTRAVDAQEHYIAHARHVARLNRIFDRPDIKAAIKASFGDQYNRYLKDYIRRLAVPHIYRAYGDLDSLSRKLRRNVAAAYLAFNLITWGKQLPSLALYLGDCTAGDLVASALEYARNPKALMDKVWSKDPEMKYRLIDPAIEEVWAATEGSNRAMDRLWRAGLKALRFSDAVAVTIGWNAVYEANVGEYGEAEAIRRARSATLRTQPAAAPEDLAGMYTQNEALNWVLMFTSQLNQLYNIERYDIPHLVRHGEVAAPLRRMIGLVISAMLIRALTDRELPEDETVPEYMVWAVLFQGVNSLPLVGSAAIAARDGWRRENPIIQGPAETLAALMKMDWMRAFRRGLETSAVLSGLPVVAGKRVYRAVKEGEPGELVGIRGD